MADDRTTHATRERQVAVLRHYDRLATAGGRSRTRVAADAGMSYDQYVRYVSGSAALRVDQVPAFAAALDVPSRDLWCALDPSIPWALSEETPQVGHETPTQVGELLPDSDWDFRAELLALAPADNPLVIDALTLGATLDEPYQKWLVEIVAKRVARARSTPNGVSGPGERQRRRA